MYLPQTNADERENLHPELTDKIISVFYEVYHELGFGFLESIYEEAMFRALKARGFRVERQAPVPVWFRGEKIGEFRADLLVEGLVIVELKAVRAIDSSHEAQTLNYLRATDVEVGLIFNFGSKPGIRRLVFSNSRKTFCVRQRSSAADSDALASTAVKS